MIKVIKEYRPIKGYEEAYMVSSLGEVLALPRKRRGNHKMSLGRTLKPAVSRAGYLRLSLCVDGVRKPKTVHRLVAEAFVPNPDSKPCVNHIDNNRLNNRADNLEWVTHQENTDHANRQGRLGHTLKPTHCIRGHEFNEVNTRTTNGVRHCRPCCRIRGQKMRDRAKDLRANQRESMK